MGGRDAPPGRSSGASGAAGQGPRALLDACVLFPTVLRQILIGAAALYTPLWSPRILEEWARAAAREGVEPVARGEIALLRARFPAAEVTPGDTTALDLPDPGDLHVLAAAIAGRADLIVTLNLRDFPARALGPIRAVHPDDFLMDLWLSHPAEVEAAVEAERRETERISGRAQPLRPLLKRARLPRLGKALGRQD